MIEESSLQDRPNCSPTTSSGTTAQFSITERAPAVLASLIEEGTLLQKAAVDAGVIKKLCQMLKRTFDPVQTTSKPLWSPNLQPVPSQDAPADVSSSTPGRRGFSREVLHAFRCREGILRALAAIADKEDAYRKAMIDNGSVACITDSLMPYNHDIISGSQTNITAATKDGNPVPVLVAACNAARSMSRSVSILRTSLIDYGIAKPILGLLSHSDTTVRIAATEVLCNLLLHFSPMREVRTATFVARMTANAISGYSRSWVSQDALLSCAFGEYVNAT